MLESSVDNNSDKELVRKELEDKYDCLGNLVIAYLNGKGDCYSIYFVYKWRQKCCLFKLLSP